MKTGFIQNILTVSLLVVLVTACSDKHAESTAPTTNSPLPAGMTFIEEVRAETGKTVIPYKKYTLNNGLTLIIHEDHSDPLAHIDMTYHVGSAREEMGKSGFAHFFEHMMFQGSEHVADEEHFKIVTEAGGTMNGSTSRDRTNYYQTVPVNQLEKVLWLESDRMGFLVDAVTQEKFETQRETVKNERGTNYDNRPYGLLNERVAEALYPDGHPYSWPTIGHTEDLNRVNVNDLKKFFLTWYGPNNATLTIGGDINLEQTLSLVDKYFGSIPRGPAVNAPSKTTVTLTEDRYISMQDQVHLPLIYMSFPTVSARHPDEAPLDILSEILGGGKTSILYKNLVKNQLAVQAQATHPCSELSCTFNLLAFLQPTSGKNLADLEKIIRSSIDEFVERGVEDDDLTKVKAKMEASFVFGLQSVAGKVSQLAANQTFTGNPNFIEDDIARYNNVTKEDVLRVFNKYIHGQHAVIMSIVPKGQPQAIAHKDNFKPPVHAFSVSSKTNANEFIVRKAKDNFDRNIQPKAGSIKQASLPTFWRHEMNNGISLLGTQSLETPTSAILIKIPGGHLYEPKDKAGEASLLASILNESTLSRSTESMSNELQKLGASVSVSSQNYYTTVFVSSLSKNIEATMALVKEKLFQPAFLPADFARLKNQTSQGILRSKKNAAYLAATHYKKILFGDGIAGLPSGGTEETIDTISLDDIKAFYAIHFKPQGTQIIAVSDLDKDQILKVITSTLSDWQGSGPTLKLDLPMLEHQKNVVYLINKDNAPQSEIRIGKRDIKQDITGEFYRLGLMNFPLGGHFNSRINLNLREDKGYTYGASSGFAGGKLAGSFTAQAAVKAEATDKSLLEFANEISAYQEKGISTDELMYLKKAINQRDALKYETPNAKLGFLAQILEHDLSPNFVAERASIVDNISASEINSLAQKHLKFEDMSIVIVGDVKLLKPKIEAMGYKVIVQNQ